MTDLAQAVTTDVTATRASSNRRILLALDLTVDSHQALRYAARLAAQESLSICLLHVVDFRPFKAAMAESPTYQSAAHILKRAERHLRLLARQELPADVPMRILVRTGKPAVEIVKAAGEICADLIITTAPKQDWLERLLSGDAMKWIDAQAPCSVLVLRESQYRSCDCSIGVAAVP